MIGGADCRHSIPLEHVLAIEDEHVVARNHAGATQATEHPVVRQGLATCCRIRSEERRLRAQRRVNAAPPPWSAPQSPSLARMLMIASLAPSAVLVRPRKSTARHHALFEPTPQRGSDHDPIK